MMTAGKYLVFRNRIDPILRACSIPEAGTGRVPADDLALYRGQTSFTQGRAFYFSKSRAESCRGQLLEVCRVLPKMSAVLPGTACTITSLELVKGGGQTALKAQMEAAEQFFALLTLSGIAAFRVAASRTGITYLNADIMYDFREYVLS